MNLKRFHNHDEINRFEKTFKTYSRVIYPLRVEIYALRVYRDMRFILEVISEGLGW